MAVVVNVYGKADLRQIEAAQKQLNGMKKSAQQSAGGVKGAFASMGSAISGTGAKIAAGLAAAGLTRWLAGSIEVAKKAQATQLQLQTAVSNAGKNAGVVAAQHGKLTAAQAKLATAAAGVRSAQAAAAAAHAKTAAALKESGAKSTAYRSALAAEGKAADAVSRAQDKLKAAGAGVASARTREAGLLAAAGKGYKDYAGEIGKALSASSNLSAYSQGDLKGALSTLVTTTGDVKGSIANLPLVMDLARAKGMDLASAAALIGKVQSGNTAILKRTIGIDAKDLSSKQALALVYSRVKGSAKAYGDSAAGAQDKASNAMKGLQKAVGEVLLPYVTKVSVAIAGLFKKFQTLPGPIQKVIVTVGAIAAAALILAPFMSSVVAVAGAFKLAALASKLWAAAQWILNAAMSANPIGLIVLGIAAVVAAIAILWTKSSAFRNAIIGIWGAIKAAAIAVWEWLVGAFKKWGLLLLVAITGPVGVLALVIYRNWEKIKGWITGAWAKIKAATAAVWNALVGAFRRYGTYILAALTGPIGLLVVYLAKNWAKIKAGIVSAWNSAVAWLKGVPGRILAVFSNIGTRLQAIGRAIVQGIVAGLERWWHTLTSRLGGLIQGVVKFVKKLLGISSPSKVFRSIGANMAAGLVAGLDSGQGAVRSAASSLFGSVGGGGGFPTAAGLVLGGTGGSSSVVVSSGALQININAGSGDPGAIAGAVTGAGEGLLAELVREIKRG